MYRKEGTAEAHGTNGNGQMDGNFGVRAVTSNPMRGGRKAEDEAS